MYTYTAIQLEHKTFGELKAIARELNIVPSGDRRCRQSWIDAIVGVQFPLLQLLEVSPGVEFDRVQEAIESFDTLAASPGVEIEALVLPVSFETSAASPGLTLSDRFVASYTPPQAQIYYQIEADGQLSLLDFQVESVDEAPDPDDFESLDAFHEAIALWDSEHYQPLEVSLDSFCEWAPCPDDWYESAEVLELPRAIESSSTCNFSIPIFGAAGDRTNRNSDEPPTAAVGARLPKPKPPNFPSMIVADADRSSIRKFARSATLLGGRSPPGGDVMA